MMTLEQIKICQRLGLDCNWALQNYSLKEASIGFDNQSRKVEAKIDKQLAPQYKTEESSNRAKVRAALQYNIKLYLTALVQAGLKTKNPDILWYGFYEPDNAVAEQDYRNIPNSPISNIRKVADIGWDVSLRCDYINKTGHYLTIECNRFCHPVRYSIDG